jgi:hypothetical protein
MESNTDSRAATLAEERELGSSHKPSISNSLTKEGQPEMDNADVKETDNADNKEKGEAGSIQNAAANGDGEDDDGEEYPTGIVMTFIVVALVLSIFLVSLFSLILPPSETDECRFLSI